MYTPGSGSDLAPMQLRMPYVEYVLCLVYIVLLWIMWLCVYLYILNMWIRRASCWGVSCVASFLLDFLWLSCLLAFSFISSSSACRYGCCCCLGNFAPGLYVIIVVGCLCCLFFVLPPLAGAHSSTEDVGGL